MTHRLRDKYKAAFFSGLAALLPTVLTLFILTFCWTFLRDSISSPINHGLRQVLTWEGSKEWYWKGQLNKQDWQLDEKVDPSLPGDVAFSTLVDEHVPWWIGFAIAVTLVLAVGFIFKGYLGRQIWKALERWIQRVPVIKVIYPYAKQVTEFFFAEKKQLQYEAAVAIEYPRVGVWSLGFVTSRGFRQVAEAAGDEVVTVFIPSSPTPVTGYTVIVPRSQLIQLDVSTDEAIRFTMSGGVIVPPRQVPEVSLKTRKLERPAQAPALPNTPEKQA
ncbi:MAG: DUF502 domain-containing protein [Planctomycetota bacterium]